MARMKQRTVHVVLIAVAAVAIGAFGFGRGEVERVSAEVVPSGTVTNTVTVGATGSIKVEPDVAYLTVAVEARGAKANEAQQANAVKFAAVEKVLYETFKLTKKDVKTTSFDVQPEYNYTEKDGQVLKGYLAVHQIQVTYRKLTEVGKLFDALSTAGVNRISGVRFDTEKADQYELEALKKAMVNASAKAGVLAVSANRQLKGVINIVQGDVSNIPILYEREEARNEMMKMADDASSSVQSGEIEITTKVNVQYEMQ